jgi:phosphatidylinositol alpha-mannosyltransferase
VLVCGKGHMELELKEFVAVHDLDDFVTFTGFVPEEEKAGHLACGDIIVYPSTGGESFGIVLLEGMAAGRGVVLGGNNPGYEGVMHERPEALFNPNNEEAFADKISQYLTDAAARKKAAVWQKEYVQRFDVPFVGRQILDVYDRALHRRRS